MWLSKDLLGIFRIAHESMADLRVDLAKVTAERDIIRRELESMRTNFDWLRAKVNGLEVERAQLIQKAYNISLPVPQLERTRVESTPSDFSFEDIGDKLAKRMGLPTFEHQPDQTEA